MEVTVSTRQGGHGYTLLEFVLVLGLASFMTAQAIPVMIDRAAQQRVDYTVEGLRVLANAAMRYRTDGREITEPGHGHYGTWPPRAADLLGVDTSVPPDGVPDDDIYVGVFRNDGAALATRELLNAVGLPIQFAYDASDPNREGVLRMQTTFRDPAHAGMAAVRFGPSACATTVGTPDCQAAGCPADVVGTGEFHACFFVPPPAQESVHDTFALLDGSRPFVLDGTATPPTQLEIHDGPPGTPPDPKVIIDHDGNLTADGTLTADAGLTVTGDVEIVDGNVDIDGRVEADIIVAREIDTIRFVYGTPASCPSGSTVTLPARTFTCP